MLAGDRWYYCSVSVHARPVSMKTTLHALLIITASLLGSPLAVAQGNALTRPVQENERVVLFPTADLLARGRSVAGSACAGCHGVDGMHTGEGQPYLAGQRAIYLYRVLKSYQDQGRENETMLHASEFLNDEALLAVAAYYASLAPARPPEPAEEVETAASLGDNPFTAISKDLRKCTKCHGETGNSGTSGMPNLTAQHPDYFIHSMQEYADGSRNNRLMGRLVGALDEETIRQMGLYFAVQEPHPSDTVAEGDAKAGAGVAEACAGCHGSDGNAGGSEMPTLAGQDARYFIKAVEAYKDGEREHEAMFDAVEGLSDTQINDLAAFYAGQAPVRRDVRTPFSTAEWVARCERCHGLEGNSTDPRFPMLAGQNAEYLKRAMQAYISGERSRSIMHAMSEPLTATDVEQIVNYYATREPKSVVYLQLPCEDGEAE